MKFEIHYFNSCPSWKKARDLVREILDEMGIEDEIKMKRIETDEEAKKSEFPGSPTIRLDGKDIFPVSHTDYALGCRVYQTPDGFQGLPTMEMLRERLVDLVEKKNQ
jgi:hypothetical protein